MMMRAERSRRQRGERMLTQFVEESFVIRPRDDEIALDRGFLFHRRRRHRQRHFRFDVVRDVADNVVHH